MTSFNRGHNALRGCSRSSSRWLQLQQQFQALHITSPLASHGRLLSTEFTRAPSEGENFAAPELDFKSLARSGAHARAVPLSPSYFSRQPTFTDSVLHMSKLWRSYKNLPALPSGDAERVAWKTLQDYRAKNGEEVKASAYAQALDVAKRLHKIHPKLKPQAVVDALKDFMKDVQPFSNVPRPIVIDRFGRALGVGKRKSSMARAWVVEGNGEVQINGKNIAEVFGRVHDRESALWALKATSRIDKYNVWALVEGGGTTGQAEALTLAIAKALMAHEPALKPALRRAGCVTRDPRTVERKKHGRVKARKMPTWVKR